MDVHELYLWDELSQIDQEKAIKILWPNQEPINIRPRLKLSKSIEEMNEDELKIELQKRDLQQYQHIKDRWNSFDVKTEIQGECRL